MQNKSSKTQSVPIVRKCVLQDLDQLVEICRHSFPKNIRWRANCEMAKQWWRAVFVSQAAEAWVVEKGGVVIAFCVLVKDEVMWAEEKEFRKGSILAHFVSALHHPLLACYQVGQNLKAAVKKKHPIIYHRHIPEWCTLEMRTWIELIAVSPDYQGKGFAKRLLSHCYLVTNRLGRKVIGLRVAPENAFAKNFYKKHGFICQQSDSKGDLYFKHIET